MNIKEAKTQIKQAMTAYFSKDEFGNYEIPIEKQRPIFLIGAPGIGKTAIMEQIAQELGVGLVSYSMTHHTRQSALGLPFITTKTYGGTSFQVSEYTMSEIIASVYDAIESTGIREGILFLDEINCVSETLAPSMLQFLQYKIFGGHQVPAGWIVVTAGNPPEYNKSVREFDIVTMDRLKKITVEPDFDVWKEYAYQHQIHPAVLTYLEIKKDHFYQVESSIDGKQFVTARGWEDLSQMLRLFEKHQLPIDEKLTCQYLQNPEIARSFAAYYDLFHKYQSDYQIPEILSGHISDQILDRAKKARFDERLALLGMLIDAVSQTIRQALDDEDELLQLLEILKHLKSNWSRQDPLQLLNQEIAAQSSRLEQGKHSRLLSSRQTAALHHTISALTDAAQQLADAPSPDFAILKNDFEKRVSQNQKLALCASSQLEQLFLFCERAFPRGQELLLLVTELTVNEASARFISRYGCPKYFEHNQELLFYERNQEILVKLEQLKL